MHHDCVALFHAGALVTVTEGSRLDSTQFGGAKPSESGALPFNWRILVWKAFPTEEHRHSSSHL